VKHALNQSFVLDCAIQIIRTIAFPTRPSTQLTFSSLADKREKACVLSACCSTWCRKRDTRLSGTSNSGSAAHTKRNESREATCAFCTRHFLKTWNLVMPLETSMTNHHQRNYAGQTDSIEK